MSLSIASLDLPERVQRIIDGVGAEGVGCSQCHQRPEALLRCSRCKIAKYCTEECQKQHFAAHKKNCRSIHKQQAILEEDWASGDEHRLSQRCVDLGDLLVKTGYGESDSIAQAARYYREALKYYLLPMTKFPEFLSPDNFPWVEDCILLLVLALGGDHTTVKDWTFSVGSERLKRCYRPASELCCEGDWDVYDADLEDGKTPDFDLAGYATDDVTFQALQLLGKLRLLNEINKHVDALKVVKEVMDTAAGDLGSTVSMDDVHGQKDGPAGGVSYLWNLMKKGPSFSKECAPSMFGGGLGNYPKYYWVRYRDGSLWMPPPNNAPDELWMIFRDAFDETPGLNSLLKIVFSISPEPGSKRYREGSVDKESEGTDDDED